MDFLLSVLKIDSSTENIIKLIIANNFSPWKEGVNVLLIDKICLLFIGKMKPYKKLNS